MITLAHYLAVAAALFLIGVFGALTRRGPHRVLRGDLGFAGLPGTVYTPESGLNLPGVAFGHDWLQGVGRYSGTLEHLASWGVVAAAPFVLGEALANVPQSCAAAILSVAVFVKKLYGGLAQRHNIGR